MGLRRPRALLLLVAACSGRRHHSTAKKQRDESAITTKSRLAPHDETSAATKSRLVHQAQLTTAFCETRSKRPPPARPDGDTYAGRRLQPYVVLSRQHSGSTWLGLTLDALPCVVCGNEKFHEVAKPHVFEDARARRRALEKALEILGAARRDAASDGFYEDLKRRPQKFTGWVDKTNATLGRRGAGAFGFKWMFTQGVLEDLAGWFFDFCLEHGVKLVWLRRRNLFKQHLSSKLTLAPDARDGKVALDAAQVLELLRDHAAEDAAIAALLDCLASRGVASARYDYEDLLAHPQRFSDLEAWSARPRPLCDCSRAYRGPFFRLLADVVHRHGACDRATRSKVDKPKNHTRHPSSYVANWGDIAVALVGTPWATMPDEP